MSESRKKFEFFANEDRGESALRVDDVAAAKEGVQEAAQALASGKMPSTGQITEAIDAAREAQAYDSGVELSAASQRVGERVSRVLDSTRRLVSEKNPDNEIQRLIHHAKIAARNLDAEGDYAAEKRSGEQNLQHTYASMVMLAKLLVTSREFRGLLADMYDLVRDVLSDHDVPYAKHLPHSHQVTDKEGAIDVAQARQSLEKVARSEDPTDKKDPSPTNREKSLQDVVDDAVKKAGQAALPVVEKAARGDTQGVQAHVKRSGDPQEIKSRAKDIQEKALDAMQQAQKKATDIARDFHLTEEQQENLVDRFAAILDELRDNSEARRAVNDLLDAVSSLGEDFKSMGGKTKGAFVQEVDENKDLSEAAMNAKRAVEHFAGNHSLDELFQLLHSFAEMTRNDTGLRELMQENRDFFARVSRDTRFVHSKEFGEAAGERFNRTRAHLLGRYREPMVALGAEAQAFVLDLKEDPATNRAVSDLQNLTRELFLDGEGRPTAKFDLLRDFQKYIPILSQRLQRLDMPRIHDQDDDGEYILDNISLACSHIAPTSVHVRLDTLFDSEEERLLSVASIALRGIHASAHEVAFYFKKKLPVVGTVEDAGLVDVAVGKQGMDLFLKLAPRGITTDGTPTVDKCTFRVLQAKCRVNDIKIKLRHTKHDFLYKVLNRMIQSNVKRRIERAVGEGVRDFLEGVERMTSNPASYGSSLPSQPLDTRPEGWKSDAFNTGN